jgi:hypothetical protein
LGYVLLYYICGNLPWENVESETDEDLFQKIYHKKRACSVEELCGGVNCLRKYWNKIKAFKVGENINYD